MGLLDKLKNKLDSSSSSPHGSAQRGASGPLSQNDIPRYRRQRGLNLGSWFVLEKWITPGPFRSAAAPGSCDLDVAKGKAAKRVLEEHWDSWIKDEDWDWIANKGFNSVRLPIGYYHLADPCPEALDGTEFEPYREVFSGAWSRIQRAIDIAGKRGIGILIDLHSAAGGQNADAHSGTNGPPRLFDSKKNLESTSVALKFLASTLSSIPHVIGLELLNEPANNGKLQGWYESTITSLRPLCGPDFPIYISDAWDTQHYAGWVGKRNDFVVLDHHVYRCFTDADKALNGEQQAQKLRSKFANSLSGQSGTAKGAIVVGEWSASIDPQSIGHMSDGEKDRQRREFVKAELEVFDAHTAGWWFWTYKCGEAWNAGWSARNAAQAEILPKTFKRTFKGPPPADVKDGQLTQAHSAHKSYWASHGGSPNSEVFAPGFSHGWDDALMFASAPGGPHEIGFVQQWAARRRTEYESANGSVGKAGWEWEHGFAQGVKACQATSLA